MSAEPFLRIPPFPGAKPLALAQNISTPTSAITPALIAETIALVRSTRIGGTYWGQRPALPEAPYTLIYAEGPDPAAWHGALAPNTTQLLWTLGRHDAPIVASMHHYQGVCDPWHMLANANHVIAPANSEVALIAALLDKPVTCIGSGRYAALDQSRAGPTTLQDVWADHCIAPYAWQDCFTGQPMAFADAIYLCAFWRDLIASNQNIVAALGMAFWKQSTVAPLLWNGDHDTQFIDHAPEHMGDTDVLAIWRSRMDTSAVHDIERRALQIAEVEDGFIRSVGLGADCVPPLSIVVDRAGIYFDPAQSSDLEGILVQGGFSAETLERARRLRHIIVEQGISKYAVATGASQRRCVDRRHVLVTGQVEDDRSVQSGGGAVQTNLELLSRVRTNAPDAYILYKPHPDVEAGHRKGSIPDQTARELANEIVRDESIGALITMVDEVHVNTSLAGFEALLRDRPVTTYGVPFYAGWGLTTDLGVVPKRRGIQRTLDELVAGALLVYPRYLDPDTGLPCPPEVLMERLMRPVQPKHGWLVALRQGQGRIRYLLNTALQKVLGR